MQDMAEEERRARQDLQFRLSSLRERHPNVVTADVHDGWSQRMWEDDTSYSDGIGCVWLMDDFSSTYNPESFIEATEAYVSPSRAAHGAHTYA
eukprot:CAMPEP_0181347328 /NCGR_PEP_ID=MMETSP1101-20121128/33821_1 /TAXON_ID=46948 /ORGANISM="Rhodomonas abbreviata, Strain Caron Lab Isolate" /LENGTH=92 /DNA_ID=CAMNT_0023459537 /DNA_START=126 /DNA_END=403 /DNA_ORIENTATION=-